MKYIDAEKLKAEIRKLRSESCISESDDYYEYAKSEIIDIIDSLQQEQPSSNLDEAAQDFVWEVMENDEDGISELSRKLRPSSKIDDYYDALADFFKAGAKWTMEQLNDK